MDLEALQTTLREFAAERDWQPFHTPKNLAMALMVEAAELAEIFQWMTPDQSTSAHADAVTQERIADEVADVLLYLLQIADHTGLDLKRAVGRKLVKNAGKHPPLRPGQPAGKPVPSMAQTHVLVDWENVQPTDAEVRGLVVDATDLWLFHGPAQKLPAAHGASFGDRATRVAIARSGKNALDFHLSFYMGHIAARQPDARFVVISNDKGYAPMLDHAASLGFAALQLRFSAAGRAPTKAAPKKPAARKAAGKVEPAAKAAVKKAALAPKAVDAKKPPATPATPVASATAAAEVAIAPLPVSTDLPRSLQHVLASLGKNDSKPVKQAKLLATIKSLLGPSADDQRVHAVLSLLLASGKVAIDTKGAVRYEL